MMKKFDQVKAVIIGLLLSSAVIPAAMADDIEIYTKDSSGSSGVNPNILFLVDTSGSMGAINPLTVREHYDSTTTYAGDCNNDAIYFAKYEKGVAPPNCSTTPAPTNFFNRTSFDCDRAKVIYTDAGTKVTGGNAGPAGLYLFGTSADQYARLDETISGTAIWKELADNKPNDTVECLLDSGIHGSSSSHYIADETSNNPDGYTSTVPANLKIPHPVWDNGSGHEILWAGNYLNYINIPEYITVDGKEEKNPAYKTITTTRMAELKRAIEIMVATNSRINIGLMSLDGGDAREGGSMQYAMQDVGASRSNFITQVVDKLPTDAFTSLSETYYEALLYYGGKQIDYGDIAKGGTIGSAKTGDMYNSPISSVCGANYIVVLSDGVPTADDANTKKNSDPASAVDRFDLLPGMSKTICNVTKTSSEWDDNQNPEADRSDLTVDNDNCLDDLSYWASTNDVATDATFEVDGVKVHEGMQTITTHTIGFALDPTQSGDAAAITLLDSAKAGEEGQFFMAQTGDDLVDIFQEVIAGALQYNTTFSSPAVSVNAFNRSTHLDDLYFTLFKPHATNNAWQGNLKKYKLKFTDGIAFIADKDNSPAVDASTGFFRAGATSYWSNEMDGFAVEIGGAASQLTNTRKVFTITGAMPELSANAGVYQPVVGDLTNEANLVGVDNAVVSDDDFDTLLGITGREPILETTPYRNTLLDWARGLDVFSNFGATAGVTSDARLNMGDPLHAEPALVQYGQSEAGVPDLVAYVATNDGYLHAFDAATGTENFSFIPQDLLKRLPGVMENNGAGGKSYGLDGNVVAWVNDVDDDGAIDKADGDRIILYFGMRRGGKNIYALDVTERNAPELLWEIKGGGDDVDGDYYELGQTWSTINVEKIKDGTTEKTVLMFGGGYDETQDNTTARRVDTEGRTIFIVDALTGLRLWSAKADADASISNEMKYSIPARVKPLDINGDGYIDRIYAADVGGQIFRFDINNMNDVALASSITGGRLADLAGSDASDARRFFYPPDVARINAPDGVYHGLVISSGFRAHPLNPAAPANIVHDRIYMIKDRNVGVLTNNDQYKYAPADPTATPPTEAALGPLTEAHLIDVTANAAGGDVNDTTLDNTRKSELDKIQSAEGWYINLDDEENPGTWIGEKGLAEALIIEGVAIVTTYVPPQESSALVCVPPEGTGKVFYLDMHDATAAFPSDADVRRERHVVLARGGIPPPPNVIITEDGPAAIVGTEVQQINLGLGIRKTYWYEVEK